MNLFPHKVEPQPVGLIFGFAGPVSRSLIGARRQIELSGLGLAPRSPFLLARSAFAG